MLSSLTIEKCSELFCYLEDSSQILKSVRTIIIKNFNETNCSKVCIFKGSILLECKKLLAQNV